LPGFDGTGMLFDPLLRSLPPGIEAVVVAYPVERAFSADELVAHVLAHLPEVEPYVLIAESFSGPIALKAAVLHPCGPSAIILCASFVQCPVPYILASMLRLCGSALSVRLLPRWLVRWYLLAGAEDEVLNLFYAAIGAVSPR